jgi:hypothetical protein
MRLAPARRLHAHAGSHHQAHQSHVVRGRAARAEAGRRLHKIGSGHLGQSACDRLLIVVEKRSLEDHLDDSAGAMAGFDYSVNILAHGFLIAGAQCADVHDHVDLLRAHAQGGFRFADLALRGGRAQREADNRTHFHGRAGQFGGYHRDPVWIHANAGELISSRFLAELHDFGASGVGAK